MVTGATGALGTAVVGALLEASALCHVPYRTDSEAQNFAHRDHPRVRLARCTDLADEAAVTALYAGVGPLWASIHIAGGFAFAPLEHTGQGLLLKQLQTNFISAYLCCRAAAENMRKSASGGRIVNVAARQALEPRLGANTSAYTAAKAAVAALTVALGEELAKDGILVNAVAPSILDTPANRSSMPNGHFDTWPKVEDVARTLVFLASPENRVTRGAIVPVYGKA